MYEKLIYEIFRLDRSIIDGPARGDSRDIFTTSNRVTKKPTPSPVSSPILNYIKTQVCILYVNLNYT